VSHLPSINSQNAHLTVVQFLRLVRVRISEVLTIRRASIGDKIDTRTSVAATPKEPVRVLHVVTIMNRAGLETMLMNYYRTIDRTKVQFDFLVHRAEKGDYDDEIKKLGGRIYRFDPITIKSMPNYKKKMMKLLKNHPEYRVVHSHLDALSALPLAAAKKAKVPLRIAHSHNTGFDKNAKIIMRYIAKHFIRLYATHYFGCSRDAIVFMFGKTIKEYKVINNAINVDDFRFDNSKRNKVRKDLGLGDSFTLGHVGRFSYPKNHEFLIDIFYSVYKQDNNATLLLVGSGHGESEIKKKVAQLKLEENVKFLGLRSDIASIMQAMDVFVMPSRFEGLPVVSIEAQASGLPCVFSDVVTKDLDITGLCEFVSLDNNADAWARRINRTRGVARKDTGKLIKKAGYSVVHQADEYIGMVF
jgi:glycosyltransferase involved in cell wall biosynthesis